MSNIRTIPPKSEIIRYNGHKIQLTYNPKEGNWCWNVIKSVDIKIADVEDNYTKALSAAKKHIDSLKLLTGV